MIKFSAKKIILFSFFCPLISTQKRVNITHCFIHVRNIGARTAYRTTQQQEPGHAKAAGTGTTTK
jgi:hypothetical protein